MKTQNNDSLFDTKNFRFGRNKNCFKTVGTKNLNRAAFAIHHIKQGQVIYNILPYSFKTYADFLSVQISIEKHIFDRLLEAMNHSCTPTTFVDVQRMQVIAIKDISPEEELTFFYPSTEWEMNRPFQCNCQSSQCIGFVSGAKNLSISHIIQFQLNFHIKSLIKHSFYFIR